MLRILAIISLCAMGSSTGTRFGSSTGTRFGRRCPPNHTQQVMSCLSPVQRFQTNPPQNLRQACRVIHSALTCLENIMDRCSSQPDVQVIASMVNMDQVRALLNAQCFGGPMPTFEPGVNRNCPGRYEESIGDCVRPLQNIVSVVNSNLGQACGLVVSRLECLDGVMDNCAGEMEVQIIRSVVNLDVMIDLVNAQCSRIGAVNTSSSNSNCPAGYSDRLMECLEPMTELDTLAEQDMNLACSVATDGIGCIDNIVSNCPNEPTVMSVVGILELDEIRPMVESVCSQGQVQIGSSDNCPADYEQRFLDCVEPMQAISSMTPGNLNHACSLAQDGFGCVETLIAKCRDKPEVQTMAGYLNFDQLRSMIASSCSQGQVQVDSSGSSCRDTNAELQRCSGLMQGVRSGSNNQEQCRKVYAGFDCFEELIRRCPTDPAVVAFTSAIDIGEARGSMAAYCN